MMRTMKHRITNMTPQGGMGLRASATSWASEFRNSSSWLMSTIFWESSSKLFVYSIEHGSVLETWVSSDGV